MSGPPFHPADEKKSPPIGEIFRAVGQPAYTFVEPEQLGEVRVRLLNMGEGLVIEGPSGAGKTTLARAALREVPHESQVWLSGTRDADRRILDMQSGDGFARGGYLIVDDFHRLDRGRQQRVANLIKAVADQNRRDAKIILIGINPVGVSLVRDLPDLAGRFAVVSLARQPAAKIEEMIRKGEAAANLRFVRRQRFVEEAGGSFIVAQMLCYEAAVKEGIIRVDTDLPAREILGSPADVADRVQRSLDDKFRPLLLSFASCDEQPPPRGGCLALLWQLSRARTASVTLTEVRYQYPQLQACFDWLLKSNLATNFESNPGLGELFYYNRATTVLSIEDPRLDYYLKHLDWRDIARASGHGPIFKRFNRREGPVFKEISEHAAVVETFELLRPPRPSLPQQAQWEILHLSDLHFGTEEASASVWSSQLLADLRELQAGNLQAIVVSGDVGTRAEPEEYRMASDFLRTLSSDLDVPLSRIILVPGNHDQSWESSKAAYTIHRKKDYKGPLIPGRFIEEGSYIEVREDAAYGRRFEPFAAFYRDLRQEDYPLEPARQATLHYLPEGQALVLGLNSAWEIDHHYKGRASIHPEALGTALREVQKTETYRRSLVKIAVFHHPLNSDEEDRIKDGGFVEQLAQAGFHLALHGHIHRAKNEVYRYSAQQHIEFLGAGTFGSPRRAWVPGFPLQYQLLRFGGGGVTVETRMRNEVNGAWKPDARWLQGPGQDPLPRYVVQLPGKPPVS